MLRVTIGSAKHESKTSTGLLIFSNNVLQCSIKIIPCCRLLLHSIEDKTLHIRHITLLVFCIFQFINAFLKSYLLVLIFSQNIFCSTVSITTFCKKVLPF
ncbi:Uncharacterised protein [Segatella copri]|nr:Uncharacterised protein [Segatella copri]